MEFRERVLLNEGDDCLVEMCTLCGKLRFENETDRPMAWFTDPTNPSGYRYAYSPHGNGDNPDTPSPWKYPKIFEGEWSGLYGHN